MLHTCLQLRCCGMLTTVGSKMRTHVFPMPHSPCRQQPQHRMAPASVKAQQCAAPHATCHKAGVQWHREGRAGRPVCQPSVQQLLNYNATLTSFVPICVHFAPHTITTRTWTMR